MSAILVRSQMALVYKLRYLFTEALPIGLSWCAGSAALTAMLFWDSLFLDDFCVLMFSISSGTPIGGVFFY